MGNYPDGYGEEGAVHPGNPVWVDSFYLDVFEVTNQQYADFLNSAYAEGIIVADGDFVYDSSGEFTYYGTGSTSREIDFGGGLFEADSGREDFPVVHVTWYGAQAYAAYYGKRLATEAEWEKAARGTSTEFGELEGIGVGYIYPWKSTIPYTDYIDGSYANYSISNDPYEYHSTPRSTPVGFFDGHINEEFYTENNVSSYGCYDMAGNAWEWTGDWYAEYSDPHNPPSSGIHKVIRGGSYTSEIKDLRCAKRQLNAPGNGVSNLGFRCADD
ncbi:SUMF1/EgtB/PvdO family nonheme iron enzyme [bacterium]|nr:SUMF1/EgtB/PvdO family nonheme iron enzyme [bacterium]